MMNNNQQLNTTIRDYFTDDEWDAIFDAICEYQDHGEGYITMSDQIQSKIRKLFN